MGKSLKLPRGTLAILILAAMLRLVLLGLKPPHFDEGVNGWFVDLMVKTGYFQYDPNNYHGPLHFYILFLFQSLLGRHIWALRLPVVLVSLATIWLVTRFQKFLPRRACLLAALAMAVSPAEVFYARYAIHEAELAFFLLLTTWGLARLWLPGPQSDCISGSGETARSCQCKGLWALGIGLAGMLLTKETYIIHVVCFALTGLCLWAWEKAAPSPGFPPLPKQCWNGKDLATVAGCGLLLVAFFYSGGFLDPSSLKGLYQTYAAWVKTGTHGNGHEKAWHYWFHLIGLFEWPVVIGLVFGVGRAITAFVNRIRSTPSFPPSAPFDAAELAYRFLTIYGCGAIVAYSLVPYKTPWCIITLIWPFFFLFGHSVDLFWDRFGKRAALALCIPLLGASLGLSIWLNFFHYTDDSVPYVYVQTTNDLRKVTGPLFKMTEIDPSNFAMRGHILLASYYPLPWVLGDFTQVGYYNPDKSPDVMDADFLLIDPDRVKKVEAALKESYFKEPVRLRSGMEPSQLYLRESRFLTLFPERTAEFHPK